ncbi:MAG: hypothetical protein R3C53_14775 [Pirellulaceae bacterium]
MAIEPLDSMKLRGRVVIVASWTTVLAVIIGLRTMAPNWPNVSDLGSLGYMSLFPPVLFSAAWWVLRRGRKQQLQMMYTACLLATAAAAVSSVQSAILWHGDLLVRTHATADLSYLASVSRRLVALRQTEVGVDHRLIDALQSGMIEWTARVVSGSELGVERRGALITLAHDVRPRPATYGAVKTYIDREHAAVNRLEARMNGELEQAQASEREAAQQYEHLSELEATNEAQRLALTSSAETLTRLQIRIQQLKKDLSRLKARQEHRADMAEQVEGINAAYPQMHLPVQIPGGPWWSLAVLCRMAAMLVSALVGWLAVGVWRGTDRKYANTFLRFHLAVAALATWFAAWLA